MSNLALALVVATATQASNPAEVYNLAVEAVNSLERCQDQKKELQAKFDAQAALDAADKPSTWDNLGLYVGLGTGALALGVVLGLVIGAKVTK